MHKETMLEKIQSEENTCAFRHHCVAQHHALAVAMGRGHSLEQAARLANKAAGIVVERFGTAVALESEVFE